MAAMASPDPRLVEEFSQVAASSGCRLLACELKGGTLQLVIDRPEGVTLQDCQDVAKEVSALLDVADFGTGKYLLEVSSPGLDRKFYSEDDYERFLGRVIRVTWQEPSMHHNRTLVARLEEFRREVPEVVIVDDATGDSYTIPLKYIGLARLEPEL
jgi:ribosome maturation factor RimP